MKITYADGVFEELTNLSLYLAQDNEEVASRFLDSCEETFQFLAANQFVGSIRTFNSTGLSEVRMWRVKNFEKYLIFYTPRNSGIRILHLLHSAVDYNRAFENE